MYNVQCIMYNDSWALSLSADNNKTGYNVAFGKKCWLGNLVSPSL